LAGVVRCMENFEKEFTALDVASAFEVTDPLTPTAHGVFMNFPAEPMIRRRIEDLEQGTPAA
jgi:hypothetical protein